MQEIEGVVFQIQTSKRAKHGFFRCDSHGVLTFYFPSKTKNRAELIAHYIKKNKHKIEQMQHKQQLRHADKMQALKAYMQQYPNALCVFDSILPLENASIESLSHILFLKTQTLLNYYANLMGLSFSQLQISYAKSYLGQCDSKGRIKICYRNVLSDEALLSYLVVHELAHLRHPNHSKAFWNEVATYYPHYKSARKLAKEMATRNTHILQHYGLLPDSYL